MAVDDVWYRKGRGPNNERLKSATYGRGKRWRCRYVDATGTPRTKYFERRVDAEAWDAKARLGLMDSAPSLTQSNLTFSEYGERWRLSRESGWAVGTRRRIPSNLRTQLYPAFGDRVLASITLTDVLEWLTECLAAGVPQSSIKLYFELLATILKAAVTDKVLTDNPCDGVNLNKVLRGLSRVPAWVPTSDDVLRLFDAVPARYHGALWLGAGQGLRLGEVLGVEHDVRCIDHGLGELHVVQQLQYAPSVYQGGFYLTEPKAGSSGTVDLDPLIGERLTEHVRRFAPLDVELVDTTSGLPVRRQALLLFATTRGNPFTDRTWSREWAKWRQAAGWPAKHGTFHA